MGKLVTSKWEPVGFNMIAIDAIAASQLIEQLQNILGHFRNIDYSSVLLKKMFCRTRNSNNGGRMWTGILYSSHRLGLCPVSGFLSYSEVVKFLMFFSFFLCSY